MIHIYVEKQQYYWVYACHTDLPACYTEVIQHFFSQLEIILQWIYYPVVPGKGLFFTLKFQNSKGRM